jgi:hypothetical protein
VLRILAQRGYQYDASTLPTFLGPLARAYYFMTTKLSPEEKAFRKKLFGKLSDGFKPIRSYRWKIAGHDKGLIEIPVTTMPLFRIPFHISYILYIYRFSPFLAKIYFQVAIRLCQLTRTSPSLLLHPLDFLGGDDIKELSFFPAMNLPGQKKVELLSDVLKFYADCYTVVPIHQHAKALSERAKIPTVEPQ